jgi:hypothetical protein
VILFFFYFGVLRYDDLIFSHLNFRTSYSRRRNLDAVFVINALGQNQLSFHHGHCRYSCAYGAKTKNFYFPHAQCVRAQSFSWVHHCCKWHMLTLGHFWQERCLIWGLVVYARKRLCDCMYLAQFYCHLFIVSVQYFIFFCRLCKWFLQLFVVHVEAKNLTELLLLLLCRHIICLLILIPSLTVPYRLITIEVRRSKKFIQRM